MIIKKLVFALTAFYLLTTTAHAAGDHPSGNELAANAPTPMVKKV